jgi:heat shock protein HslJ
MTGGEIPMNLFRFCPDTDRKAGWLIAALVALGFIVVSTAGFAGESSFPFDQELLLDAKPMKGSQRVPILDIGQRGETTIDLWCNSVQGQIVVVESTISIMTGAKTERQCDAARMRGDDDLLAALLQATSWRREGDTIVLLGARTLRFRAATN